MRRFLLMNCNQKAMVTEDGARATLTSYATEVARVENGVMYRAEGQPQSVTTARHMREFAMLYGLDRMTRRELSQLPTYV